MLNVTANIVRYAIVSTPTLTYSIPYPYWNEGEIEAYLTLADGTISKLIQGTDYSVSAADGQSGTLTRLSSWPDGCTKVSIAREIELKQLTDFRNGDVIDADTIETTFDTMVALVQQLSEIQSRAITTPIDEAGDNIALPGKVQRQGSGSGTILGFDGTGAVGVVRDLAQFDAEVTQVHNDASDASDSKDAAALSEAKAQKWAENPEDTPVETGKYSAKHHALKAATSASTASTAATNAGISETNAGNSETNANNSKIAAQGAQTAAETARDKAKKWAEEDEDVPVETDKYSAKHYAEKAGSSATAAGLSEGNAASSEAKAEKWAEEAEDTPVEVGKYSAKHYAEKAAESASNASTSETNAGTSETNAGNSAGAAAQSEEDAEAWAVGQRNGVDVAPDDPTYRNNAKFYAESAGGMTPITAQEIHDTIDALFA